MLRTVFSPRLVALHLLLVVVLVSFGLLGRWQLGVFEDSGRPRVAADPAPVAVSTLTQAGRHMTTDAVSRRVTAEGTYDLGRQLLVAGRDGGFWVLAPLDLGDGTAIPVVRGRITDAADPAAKAAPQGKVTVTGRLRPSEQVDGVPRRVRSLPEGQVLTVSTAELINVWSGLRLRDGYVVATGQNPPDAAPLTPVHVDPPTVPGGSPGATSPTPHSGGSSRRSRCSCGSTSCATRSRPLAPAGTSRKAARKAVSTAAPGAARKAAQEPASPSSRRRRIT
ncbi:SURF1 family protein [Thermocatellispora tengchongensis]|uniref:SURF1 family protein n=1 Tax=Thermocatellispora tengchongensis TaxID=1073253 RepID=UPI00363FD7CC